MFLNNKHNLFAVDMFAGLGGWTCAAESVGMSVLWAANHWPAAVAAHSANHPDTVHACQDLHQADWSAVPSHDLLLASPCCQGHARARGTDKPHHDASRATMWAVVSCAEFHRPAAAVIENVPELLHWPLLPAWREAMVALGYSLSDNVIDAADCGAAQNRVRLYIVATRSKTPLVLNAPAVPRMPARSIIDFNAGRWSPVLRPRRAVRTIERWENGRRAFGDRFVFSFYGATQGGRSIDRPIGTITTRDRWAVVDGDRMRMLTIDEARQAMGFPAAYKLPSNGRLAMHLLGNAVHPLAGEYVINELGRAA